MSEHSGMPPAGWYPETDGWERFWDGTSWTADRRAASSTPSAPTTPPPAEATQMAGPSGAPPASPPPGSPPAGSPPTGYGAVGSDPYPPTGQPYAAPGGYPPPDAGGFGGPGYPPPKQGKSKLWLWVTLAVVLVLVVGTGVTLAVTQPWSDDSSSAGDKGDDDDGGDGGDGEGTSEGLAARSDFDGDGNGDVAGTFYNDRTTALVTLSSNGSEFAVDDGPGNTSGLIWDDWAGEGTAAALSWRYSAFNDELEIQSAIGEFDSDTWGGFGLWKDAEYWLRMDSGDFNGDGSADLALVGQTAERAVTVWVMLGSGTGFESPEEWAVIDGATFGSTQIFPGDYDEDGSDDLVALLPTDASSIPKDQLDSSLVGTELGSTLLTSTGEGFEQGDDLGETPFTEDVRMQRYYTVGDFRGDGKPLVAMQSPDYTSRDVVFFEFVDGDFMPTDLQAEFSSYLQGLTSADVDGDGRDDLVTVRSDSEDSSTMSALLVETYLSEGEEIGTPAQWAELDCSDTCTLAFDNTSGY